MCSSSENTAPGNDSTSRTQRTARDFHDCEKTRTRKFSSKWQVGRPWLRNEEKGMFCEWCTEHRQALETQNILTSTKFIDGCTNYKAESISYHEKSAAHLLAIKCRRAKLHPEKTPAYLARQQMLKQYSDDEGMISDYGSEPEMSEDDVLKYIAETWQR